jgi:hypothetical protein
VDGTPTAATVVPVVVPVEVPPDDTLVDPPAAKACSDRFDSSWWWEIPAVRVHNGCDKPLNYVLVHFRVNTAAFSTDQTLLEMVEALTPADAYGRLAVANVGQCSQVDLYVGITIADIEAGRVLIHPQAEGQANYVRPLDAWLGELGPTCAPPPTSSACPEAILGASLLATGPYGEMVVTLAFSIKPGFADVEISLVSRSGQPESFLPQAYRDGATGFFDAGGPYQLQVNAFDFWQVDGLCGPLPTYELNASTIDEDEARTFIYTYTGSEQPFYEVP